MENFVREDIHVLEVRLFLIECLIYVLAQINGKFPHGFSEKDLTR